MLTVLLGVANLCAFMFHTYSVTPIEIFLDQHLISLSHSCSCMHIVYILKHVPSVLSEVWKQSARFGNGCFSFLDTGLALPKPLLQTVPHSSKIVKLQQYNLQMFAHQTETMWERGCRNKLNLNTQLTCKSNVWMLWHLRQYVQFLLAHN